MDGLRNKSATAQRNDGTTSLTHAGVIEIPHAAGSSFDHGIFDPKSGRVFIAHTARSTIEVIDPVAGRHIATLPDFPGVRRRRGRRRGNPGNQSRCGEQSPGSTPRRYKIKGVFPSGRRPNGAAIVKRKGIGIAACIGDADQAPALQAQSL